MPSTRWLDKIKIQQKSGRDWAGTAPDSRGKRGGHCQLVQLQDNKFRTYSSIEIFIRANGTCCIIKRGTQGPSW